MSFSLCSSRCECNPCDACTAAFASRKVLNPEEIDAPNVVKKCKIAMKHIDILRKMRKEPLKIAMAMMRHYADRAGLKDPIPFNPTAIDAIKILRLKILPRVHPDKNGGEDKGVDGVKIAIDLAKAAAKMKK